MKQYNLILSEEQLMLVARCLEDVSRFASGQCDMENTIDVILNGEDDFERQDVNRGDVERLLGRVKYWLFPDLRDGSTLGYNGSAFIGNVYQIYRSIYYHRAIEENLVNVYSSPPLVSGNLGGVKIETINSK